MKNFNYILVLFLALAFPSLNAAAPTISFQQLLLLNERDPRIGMEAKQLAASLGLPRSIYFRNGVLVEALGIESGQPVYAVITNAARPFDGGLALFYREVVQHVDVSKGTVNPTGPILMDARRKERTGSRVTGGTGVLLVPDWTADRVMAFDPMTGDLVDTAFTNSNSSALASPKEARLSPKKTITVSDQITDLVQAFDTSGAYISHFAPAGGVNTSILDNIRGHAYRPNGRLVVTVGSGANQNCVAEFDTGGNYLGQFIAAGSGGLNSPFSILFRANDVLVSASSSPTGVQRYDLNGTYISQWAAITSFPQQIAQLNNGTIAVANFSGAGQTGIRLYSSDGTFQRLLSGVTGNRGVYQLGNGHFLTTNAAGIHEIDSSSGALRRTIATGSNFQYINLVDWTNIVAVDEPRSLPESYVLEQNYPNPFNPSTKIKFQIPNHQPQTIVTLKIFDLLGREVATLVNEVKAPGKYEVEFNAGALSSGIYFYRLTSGNLSATKKLVLMK